ncbi:MAG: Abi family protein [Patulibacter sp.]|nr:Abi family protein [Patulibacter sp.]
MPPTISQLIPPERLNRYHAASGPAGVPAEQLYLWCEELALAMFADIGRLEIILRSAMARELKRAFGPEWYTRAELFDDDTTRMLRTAWNQNGLTKLRESVDDPHSDVTLDVVEGKLVAGLMFGFWVQLVGRGSYAGSVPLRSRRIYDTLLWRPALQDAFPGQSRREVEHLARATKAARNRIAHHEHIAWGVPLPGQRQRLSVAAIHNKVLHLATCLSPTARAWIDTHSTVTSVVDACPVDPTALRLT